MSFLISIIYDSRVDDSKGGNLSHVDDVAALKNLNELAEIATLTHIAPGVFRNNVKRQDALESIQFVSFDFDDGKFTAQQIHEQLKFQNIAHLILGSKNHLKDKGDGKGIVERFHVFIPTDVPLTSVTLYKFICKKVTALQKWTVDKNCIEPSRYFFQHSHTLFVHESANPLSVDRFTRLFELEQAAVKRRAFITTIDNVEPVEQFKKTKYFNLLNELNADGERYSKSCIIIGAMIKCGLSKSDMMSFFEAHATWGKSFTRQSVERRIDGWQ